MTKGNCYAFYELNQRVRILPDDERPRRFADRLQNRTGTIIGSRASPLYAAYYVDVDADGRKKAVTAYLEEHELKPIT